jgi:SAM-dependent methyltransferase
MQNFFYFSDKDDADRKTWYSPAANAYAQVRPRYPPSLIARVVELAQLSNQSRLLELGYGPAIVTTEFATLGNGSGRPLVHAIEPNPDFVRLAQAVCEPYPNVSIQNCAFEDYDLPAAEPFDAVIAASSFHWINPDVRCSKAKAALRPNGHLILLWNKEMQPTYDVFEQLSPVYAAQAPHMNRIYETPTEQIEVLNQFAQLAIDSGHFVDLVSESITIKVTYSIDQYLLLLGTYSPYLELKAESKERLFQGLRQILQVNGETVELTYVSVFHLMKPNHGPQTG